MDENRLRFSFIGLSTILLVVLFITDFQLLGSTKFAAIDLDRSFIINLVTSILVLVFFVVFMVYTNDASERKLIELTFEVREKNKDLEKVNRELDRFFYSASHDLRAPLLGITGAINSGMSEFTDARVLSHLEVLKRRADKLDNFLQDVIDYARNAQTDLLSEAVNVKAVVYGVIENFTFVKGADKIKFIVDVSDDLNVEVDRVRLAIILTNIISNSIKYHRLDQSEPWVKTVAHFEEGHLTVSVEDNGQGIEDELIPKIFNMFFRGTNQSKGSGLGLYIVKETVEKMNGEVSVVSKIHTGTRFIVAVPATLYSTPFPSSSSEPSMQRV